MMVKFMVTCKRKQDHWSEVDPIRAEFSPTFSWLFWNFHWSDRIGILPTISSHLPASINLEQSEPLRNHFKTMKPVRGGAVREHFQTSPSGGGVDQQCSLNTSRLPPDIFRQPPTHAWTDRQMILWYPILQSSMKQLIIAGANAQFYCWLHWTNTFCNSDKYTNEF